MEILDKNIGKLSLQSWDGQKLRYTKCLIQTRKPHQLNFIQIKNFCFLKDTIKIKIKDWQKIWAHIIYVIKDLHPGHINNSHNSVLRSQTTFH